MPAKIILEKTKNATTSPAAASIRTAVNAARASGSPAPVVLGRTAPGPAPVVRMPAAVIAQATSTPVPSATSAAVQAQVEITAQARGYDSAADELRAEQEARRLAEIRQKQAEAAAMNAAQSAAIAEAPREGVVTQADPLPDGAKVQVVSPNPQAVNLDALPKSGPLYEEAAYFCRSEDDLIPYETTIEGQTLSLTNYRACVLRKLVSIEKQGVRGRELAAKYEHGQIGDGNAANAPPPPPAPKPFPWWIVTFFLFGF